MYHGLPSLSTPEDFLDDELLDLDRAVALEVDRVTFVHQNIEDIDTLRNQGYAPVKLQGYFAGTVVDLYREDLRRIDGDHDAEETRGIHCVWFGSYGRDREISREEVGIGSDCRIVDVGLLDGDRFAGYLSLIE